MITNHMMSARSLQYYVISRKWASDLDFYKIETAFFHRLIEDHFISLSAPEHINDLKSVGKKLLMLEVELSNANKMLTGQLHNLELMAEDIIGEDAEALASRQVQLEYLINNITRQFREIKKVLFDLVERVVKNYNISLAS